MDHDRGDDPIREEADDGINLEIQLVEGRGTQIPWTIDTAKGFVKCLAYALHQQRDGMRLNRQTAKLALAQQHPEHKMTDQDVTHAIQAAERAIQSDKVPLDADKINLTVK